MVFVFLQPGGLENSLGLKTGMPHKASPDVALAMVLPPRSQVRSVFNDIKSTWSLQNIPCSLPFYQLFYLIIPLISFFLCLKNSLIRIFFLELTPMSQCGQSMLCVVCLPGTHVLTMAYDLFGCLSPLKPLSCLRAEAVPFTFEVQHLAEYLAYRRTSINTF